MREQPEIDDLLQGVAEFLRQDAMPNLTGRPAFHARVAANAIDLVRRELALGPAADARETARLEALLGHGGELAALNAEFCDRIRADEIGPETPGFAEHLWASTLDKLAVDQPNYGSYRRHAGSSAAS